MAAAGSKIPGVTTTSRRSSGRSRKQQRRDRARKVAGDAGGGDADDGRAYRVAVRIDFLEDVVDDSGDDEEEEYDELEEIEGETKGSRKRQRGRGGGSGSASSKKVGVLPKRLKSRSLASILLEEASRPDGVAIHYLGAESKPPPMGTRPKRKYCPVTGLLGVYTEPKSGIPYSNLEALEQIRERAPPWMNRGGSAAYSEAMRSLKNDDNY